MKYSSTRFDDFEFHDSELSFVLWDSSRLIVTAKYLNVHKDAAPNNTDTDMEILEKRLKEFRIERTLFLKLWKFFLKKELFLKVLLQFYKMKKVVDLSMIQRTF